MKNPSVLRNVEKDSKTLVLIVDKIGAIGERLSQNLLQDYIVFFASAKAVSKPYNKIIHIPFKNKIPKVPENTYEKIFIVDDGDSTTRESLFSFIRKAKTTNSSIYFLGSIRNIDLKHSDEIIKSYTKTRVLLFGDLFDDEMLFDNDVSITKFILEVRKNKNIKVRGNGLSLNYPMSLDDTIKLIIKATHIEIPERVLLLFYKHPITDISLANTFQKIDPEINVDFSKEDNEKQIYLPLNSQYALLKYDLKTKLSEINLENEKNNFSKNIEEEKIELKYFKPILLFIFACIFLLMLPFITTSAYTFLGFNQLNSARNLAENGNFEKALEKANNAETFFNFAEKTNGPFIYEMNLIGQERRSDILLKKINAGLELSYASVNLLGGAVKLQEVYLGKSANSKQSLDEALNSFKSANAALQGLNISNEIQNDMEESIDNIIPLLNLISNTSDAMPQILGFESEKKYLILFQNNLEIRPGGGVVESGALLSIKDGNIKSFNIIDVEEIDKKIDLYIEQPFYLRRYLPSEESNLRNSANSADFINSAINGASVYKLESGNDVDGVIGVNLIFFKNLLNAIGPVNVNGKQLNSEHIYMSSLTDQNFYGNLLSATLNKMKNNKIPYFSVAEEIGRSIDEKNLLFAFEDPDTQRLFNVNNLSSSLIDDRINDKSVNDYFGISEANLGKEKTNYFISRSVMKTLRVDKEGQFSSTLKIAYKNSSQNTENSKYIYRNYLQIILPIGSRIQKVTVGGESKNLIPALIDPQVYERNGFVSPNALEIEQVDEGNKSIFGFLVSIPSESSKTVSVEYALPFNIGGTKTPVNYSLYVFKQPGIESYPFEQAFNLSLNYSINPNKNISEEIRKDMIFKYSISGK